MVVSSSNLGGIAMGVHAVLAVFAGFFLLVILPIVLLATAHRRARSMRLAEFASSMSFSYCRTLPGDVCPLVASGHPTYQSTVAESFLRGFGDCPFLTPGHSGASPTSCADGDGTVIGGSSITIVGWNIVFQKANRNRRHASWPARQGVSEV